ncbi:MarR family winged helix-turn-helix transcriptional regulator [Pseudonocardia petroleophila]|uniref:MarR family winged helix-turn-helix transcriptional regulator n=1 Tax=Pseudonocardia petroleophila TaxID=37331 RepID=UPI001C8B3FBB|nr:MarR family winged helix-turn-helix transcriptional regulator [Pseudonocardia petroleophila]
MTDDPLGAIERELMLIGRHHLSPVHTKVPGALDRSAYVVLSRLEAGGPLTARGIADALTLEISTVTRQVGAMRRAGLVERIPDPDGGPAHLLRPTGAGRRRLAADRAAYRGGIGRVLEDWSDHDRAQLRDVLRRLNEDIEARQAQPWPRPDRSAAPSAAGSTAGR